MTPAEKSRTLRSLLVDHISRPDPVAWMAAADVYEECGDDKQAAFWRRRAKWFDPILDRYGEEAKTLYGKDIFRPHKQKRVLSVSDKAHLHFKTRMLTTRVSLMAVAPGAAYVSCRVEVFTELWMHNSVEKVRYTNRRALALIDRLDREKYID